MITIKDLSLEWWGNLSDTDKYKLDRDTHYLRQGRGISWQNFTEKEIENIFYNEVIFKWWLALSITERNQLAAFNETNECFIGDIDITALSDDEIKEIYLKEHTKEEKSIINSNHIYKNGDKLVVCGAGKFNEEKLVLSKEQAMLLYIDLHKFIMGDEQPKEEVDVWEEMINKLNDLTFQNLTSENPLLNKNYSKWIFEQMKQHYTLKNNKQ